MFTIAICLLLSIAALHMNAHTTKSAIPGMHQSTGIMESGYGYPENCPPSYSPCQTAKRTDEKTVDR